MRLLEVVLSYVLFTSTALGHPRASTRLAERVSNRASGRQTNPLNVISKTSGTTDCGNQSNQIYSSNWSGAVLTSPPAGTTFNGVSATFIVPTPRVPSGQPPSGRHSAAAWVGIDGDTYQNAILQTGVDFTISDGTVSYSAWYEWYPDRAYDFPGINISAGDSITASVTSTSNTTGEAVIVNNSNGQRASQSLSSSSALAGENAEWIVEAYLVNGVQVDLADFGEVTFNDTVARTGTGSVGLEGADLLDIMLNDKVYTRASSSGSSVTVRYVG